MEGERLNGCGREKGSGGGASRFISLLAQRTDGSADE